MIENELKLHVETARSKHLKAMVEINKAAAPKWHKLRHLNSAIREKRVLIAFVGRIPAGFLVWTKDFYSHYFIDLVVVHPKMRRHGVAVGMIRAMENFCTGNKLFSSTNRSNKAMQKVFTRTGFIKSGFISNLDKGNPEWIYYKKVAAKAEVVHRKKTKTRPRKTKRKTGKRKK